MRGRAIVQQNSRSVPYGVSLASSQCSPKMIDRKTLRRLLAAALAVAAVGLSLGGMTIGEAGQFVDLAFQFVESFG